MCYLKPAFRTFAGSEGYSIPRPLSAMVPVSAQQASKFVGMFVGTAICFGILSFVFSGTYHVN
jgi:hypothetical protein